MPTDTKATLLCFVVSWQVLLGVNNDEALVGLAVAVQSMHARSAALLAKETLCDGAEQQWGRGSALKGGRVCDLLSVNTRPS
jgi:hypothetical protein